MKSNGALDEIQAILVAVIEGYLLNLDWDIWDISKQCRPRKRGVWSGSALFAFVTGS